MFKMTNTKINHSRVFSSWPYWCSRLRRSTHNPQIQPVSTKQWIEFKLICNSDSKVSFTQTVQRELTPV